MGRGSWGSPLATPSLRRRLVQRPTWTVTSELARYWTSASRHRRLDEWYSDTNTAAQAEVGSIDATKADRVRPMGAVESLGCLLQTAVQSRPRQQRAEPDGSRPAARRVARCLRRRSGLRALAHTCGHFGWSLRGSRPRCRPYSGLGRTREDDG